MEGDLNMAATNSVFTNFFSAKGRLRRRHFGIILIILVIIRILLYTPAFISKSAGQDTFQDFIHFALIIILLLQLIKRCHDIGSSGWLSLIALIPLVGFLYLLLYPGIAGPNQYGDDPKNTYYNID